MASSSAASMLLRASRPAFRQSSTMARQAFRQQSRRWQSTDGGAQAQAQQGWFKRMWESEIGFKTVHFW